MLVRAISCSIDETLCRKWPCRSPAVGTSGLGRAEPRQRLPLTESRQWEASPTIQREKASSAISGTSVRVCYPGVQFRLWHARRGELAGYHAAPVASTERHASLPFLPLRHPCVGKPAESTCQALCVCVYTTPHNDMVFMISDF
jgi:hypothetical protein